MSLGLGDGLLQTPPAEQGGYRIVLGQIRLRSLAPRY
jgi:hypothetical protein